MNQRIYEKYNSRPYNTNYSSATSGKPVKAVRAQINSSKDNKLDYSNAEESQPSLNIKGFESLIQNRSNTATKDASK